MKSFFNIIILFITIMTLFVITDTVIDTFKSYHSYKYSNQFSKVKVKIDSVKFQPKISSRGGEPEHYNIFYENKSKSLKIYNKENYLFANSKEKEGFIYFNNVKKDSMYLWVNPNSEPIFALKSEKRFDSDYIEKKFFTNIIFVFICLILYFRVVFLLIRPKKIKK